MAGHREDDGEYRQEDGFTLIEVDLERIEQLYNTLDPSPFRLRDLDAEAHDYIVGSAREIGPGKPVKLVLHLPAQGPVAVHREAVTDMIHHYFAARAGIARLELHNHMRIGRIALAVGLLFLGGCITLRRVFFVDTASTFDQVMAEGLLICGWVAMWRPLEIMLYDWWPIRRDCRIYDRLAAMPVELRPRQPDDA
ncbi:MAG: hypothetical protein J0H82_19365 [Alphaproteobacteria bacterium]|nr:hypothetical protein [Alphaproteobacteria bacterium]